MLLSRVLAMDETPIKADKSRTRRGTMHQAYYRPLYGDADEAVLTYADSRAQYVIETLLNERFVGVLLSDGYKAYATYVVKTDGLVHAQCWSHTRQQFFEARDDEPAAVDACLERIEGLYQMEEEIRDASLNSEAMRAYRLRHSKPIVDSLLEWAQEQQQRKALLPSSPFTKALDYLLHRRIGLQIFIEDPDVAPDTKHVERAIRPISMSRKAWLFCWSEVGAEYVGVIQSPITTCKLHQVDPYVYLTDVLQRIDRHPNQRIIELAPRVWKAKFAANPLISELDIAL